MMFVIKDDGDDRGQDGDEEAGRLPVIARHSRQHVQTS